MVGSLGKIYESIEAMNTSYMEPNVNKEDILNPKVYSSLADTSLLLGNKSTANELNATKVFYRCNSGCVYISNNNQVRCTACGYQNMTVGMTYIGSSENVEAAELELNCTYVFYICRHGCAYLSNNNKVCTGCCRSMRVRMTYIKSPDNEEAAVIGKGGYVKELVNYMVMDNLVVKPMSTISSITLLSNVKDMKAVETLEVYIGNNEAVELLKASFVTDRVLTSLFLEKQNTY